MNWEYIIAIVIVAILVPLVKQGWTYLGLKIQNTKWEAFYAQVNKVVNAGEQMYKNGELDDRLNYATGILQKWLTDNGLKLDAKKLKMYIESEVSYLPPTHEGL